MPVAHAYQFRAATADDLPLLTRWQSAPHVSAWWDADPPYDESDLADPKVARWIVSHDATPFAFMQDYAVHGWPDHHFASLPKGSRGIDQFIGVPKMIGLGHGPAFIGQRMQALFRQGAPMIASDPHPDNRRAIAAYKKLGFAPLGPPQDTQWGVILPMAARRQALR